MSNPIFEQLKHLGICDETRIEKIQNFVRDRDDINVLRCNRSGVIFLSRTDHMDMGHYDEKAPTHRFGKQKRAMIATNEDTERRFRDFANIVRGKRWLDVGAGSGSVLDRLGPLTLKYAAIEPQAEAAEFLGELGHPVFRRLEDAPRSGFDVVTLFHVFEHLLEPLNVLDNIRERLTGNGRLVIEIPHASDFLIGFVDSPEFRAHTFWSEHLILHTRASISALLEASGFRVNGIRGVQRYPLANHLYWLSHGKPGGHEKWAMLRDESLDREWANVLARLDLTDTLMVEAVPGP